MSYICKRCGYSSKFKCNLKTHIYRKKTCLPVLSDISIETIRNEFMNFSSISLKNPSNSLNSSSNSLNSSSISLNFPSNSLNFPQIPSKMNSVMNSNKFVCEYCEKTFSRKDNLERHQTVCKKKKEMNLLKIMTDKVEEQEKRIQEMKEEHAMEKEALRKEIEKLLEKVGNNNNNKCYNIKNQTIMINSFGKENLDYITSELLQKLLKGPYSAVPKLIKNIHFHPKHPENHNVKITNKKLPYASVWDKNKWLIKDKRDVIESMVDKSFNLLDEQLEDNPDCIETEKKITFSGIQDKYEGNDRDTHKLLQKEAELILLNGNITMEDQAP